MGINKFTVKPLADVAWRVDEVKDNNQHYNTGTILVYPNGDIHFMQTGEAAVEGTFVIQPPVR